MKRFIWIVIFIVATVLLLADIFLFIEGSLEAFPTEEQLEKGRMVWGLFFIPLLMIEGFSLVKIFQKRKR